MVRRVILAMVGLLVVSGTGVGQGRIERALRSTKVSVDFSDLPLEDFARRIAQLSGENVVVRGAPDDVTVSITLKNVAISSLLKLALKPHDLFAPIEDGVITIRLCTEVEVVLELYDVRDLTAPLMDFPGAVVRLSPNEVGIDPGVSDRRVVTDVDGETVAELMLAHVVPESWDELEGASITAHDGVLVVRQSRENHRKIERFLTRLRRLK